MDPMENINIAADALRQVAERAGPFWDDADARVNAGLASMSAKEIALQAQVDGFFEEITRGRTSTRYDSTVIISKDGVSPVVDANHADRTEWMKLPSIQNTLPVGRAPGTGLNVVDMQRAYVVQPGTYEAPAYSNDVSRSAIEMCLSPGANHSAVEAALISLGISEFDQIGGWNAGSFNYLIPAASGGYCSLWYRFANRHYQTGDYTGQDILTFGGNSGFTVNAVHTFTNP